MISLIFLALAQSSWPLLPPLPEPVFSAGSLPQGFEAKKSDLGQWLVAFRFLKNAQTVHLAGSFNGWSKDATPMQRQNGEWVVEVPLQEGVHHYKFVVNGEQWLTDTKNADALPDGHGGSNSVLRLGELWQKQDLSKSESLRGDGQIMAAAIRHDVSSTFFFQSAGDGRVVLRVQCLANDVERVDLTMQGFDDIPMSRAHYGDPLETWEVTFPATDEGTPYTFVFQDSELRATDYQLYSMPKLDTTYPSPPSWARHAIWYQIMPDRFRNGEPSWDPTPVNTWKAPYEKAESFESKDGKSYWKYSVFNRRYGGDLVGLEDKLPYLKELGVNALYLTPVFQSISHHRYNATDYIHIDDVLGGGDYAAEVAGEDLLDPSTWVWTTADKRFLKFVRKAKAMGFRVILDGVWNHVGQKHPAFIDVQKKGESSKYADWFDVRSWKPFQYEGWAGFGELPVFKKSSNGFASASVKQHIFDVTQRWMDPDADGDPSDGIDGWRLDVPNEVPMPFWDDWCAHVKTINPDAYISGEIWHRADDWVGGGRFDAVMNYPFASAVVEWCGVEKPAMPTADLAKRLSELQLVYSAQNTAVMMNLLDSHDTDRLVSMMENPGRNYDQQNRVQDTNPNYYDGRPSPSSYQRARLAVLFQMTWLGAPMIWYGDEVGLWGADDPMCRRPMLWNDLGPYASKDYYIHEEHLEFYKEVIALRNSHPALQDGSLKILHSDDTHERLFAFLRSAETQEVVVALNASNSKESNWQPKGDGWRVVFSQEKDRCLLPPLTGCVWVRSR
ncbi:MAG: DUF3459 domain-containing protein [Planctomycetes bacterium]|nr:DUF3459 domain-containing protein [Planctomycetota bacterium]